jgi:uncharacterized protein (TIGR03435 family)
LISVWLCGVGAGVAFWLKYWRRMRRVRRGATPLALRLPIPILSAAAQIEPGVFGIFRPVLLLPEGIESRLAVAQLDAVLAHEMCHVRRRDNLTAAVHMAVETVFWFHPLVRWIRARLVEERELACDEEVLRLGSDAEIYAEGIIEVCKSYAKSPVACVSGISGSDLKKRVVRIVDRRFGRDLNLAKKLICAQSTTNDWEKAAGGKMSFDVVSVKQDTAGLPPSGPAPHSNIPLFSGSVFPPNGGRLSITNLRLPDFIVFAYKIGSASEANALSSQLPRWAQTERFDIEARAPEGTTKDQMRLMMQSLLADRFKLAIHYETRQEPVYSLVFVKPEKMGPNLRPYGNDEPPCGSKATGAAPTSTIAGGFPAICGGIQPLDPSSPGAARLGSRNIPMSLFAGTFAPGPGIAINRPIVDKTGIKGNVDFVLEFYPLSENAPDVLPGPTFLEAVKDQLGLKLNGDTAPVTKLVIDHAEEPTPN